MQENYIVGIYARLSRDDERAGESVSIENQELFYLGVVKKVRVWDYPKNENREFRWSAGALCFSGVGTHRICLLLCKKIPVNPRRSSQVYLHLLCLLFHSQSY